MFNLQRARGVMLRPGRWVEWALDPIEVYMDDGRQIQISPGDWVLLGQGPGGGYTQYLWHKKRVLN